MEPAEEPGSKNIPEAEQGRARMYQVPGNSELNKQSYPQFNQCLATASVSMMDQDYQMIDAHVEESLKRKVQDFEYIDLAKLIPRFRPKHLDEEGQRLEIINKNGQSFLSPVSDNNMSINSYSRWEQAFRIFCNIVTTKYPNKATELLQYNHTVHSAALAYSWDNVYAYDREFRQHIARHPTRPWNIILQQAWTMILKDRIKQDSFGKGKTPDRTNEPCRRFNKGKCNFGLSCKYEHCCAVKRCSKFGHGAHMCRLRNNQHQGGEKSDNVSHPP